MLLLRFLVWWFRLGCVAFADCRVGVAVDLFYDSGGGLVSLLLVLLLL